MKTESELFIVVTKFGFIEDTFEDYTDIDEDNPLSILYNAHFTSDPFKAAKYHSADQSTYKYAQSKKHHWSELTVEKWAEEIGGKLVKCKLTSESINSFENGMYTSGQVKKLTILDDEFQGPLKFEEFDYEALEIN